MILEPFHLVYYIIFNIKYAYVNCQMQPQFGLITFWLMRSIEWSILCNDKLNIVVWNNNKMYYINLLRHIQFNVILSFTVFKYIWIAFWNSFYLSPNLNNVDRIIMKISWWKQTNSKHVNLKSRFIKYFIFKFLVAFIPLHSKRFRFAFESVMKSFFVQVIYCHQNNFGRIISIKHNM